MVFRVDLSDIVAEFSLQKEIAEDMLKQVLDDVTMGVMYNWRKVAAARLRSTRNEYLRSIYWSENTRNKNVILLTGTLANMIELGAQPFDLKEGFEKSIKVKHKKDGGWYLTVPFRWATPGALGENEAFSGVMSPEVYQIAKGLRPSVSAVGRSKSGQSISTSALPLKNQNLGIRQAATNTKTGQHFPAYQHKSPLMAGMQRNQKTYQSATQSTYGTFRRVSDKSDSNSWIHTGIEARNFAEKAFAATDFDTIVNNSVDKFLNNIQ